MKNLLKRRALLVVSKLLAGVAMLFVSTASMWVLHRPKTPSELSTKK